MGRRSRHRSKEAPELDITAFLNLMVVLVPFLLVSAVFSRITILELNMPAGASPSSKPNKEKVTIEVIVREKSLEIGDGRRIIVRLPKISAVIKAEADDLLGAMDAENSGELGDQYDLKQLSQNLMKIKANHPKKEDATVLMEPEIEYDILVQVMDAVRSAEVMEPGEEKTRKLVLFPEISIGDAP